MNINLLNLKVGVLLGVYMNAGDQVLSRNPEGAKL